MNSKSTKILLVEDNPADARFTKELLPSSQYFLISAESLAEAMDCIKDTKVDVVLLDLALPDSVGVETVAKLIAQRKELPIVVLTGLEDVECAIEALRVGAHDYIVKGKLNEELLVRSIDLAIQAKKHQLTRDNLLSKTRLNKLSAAVAEALITSHNLSDYLKKCTDALWQQLNLIHAHIWTLNDHLNEFHLLATSGECTSMKPGETYISCDRKYLDPDVQAEFFDILAKKTLTLCEADSSADPATGLLIEPLRSDDRLFGLLTLHLNRTSEALTVSSLKTLAEQISLGIEKKLSEAARALLANIVHCSEDGIISCSLDHKVKTWNVGAEKIFGYSFEEALGKDISLFLPANENPQFEGIQDIVLKEEILDHLELKATRKDGQYREVALTISALQDQSASVYGTSMIVRDITAKKLSERIEQTLTEVMKFLNESDTAQSAAPRILDAIREVQTLEFAALWEPENDGKRLICLATSSTDNATPEVNEFAALSSRIKLALKDSLPGRALEKRSPVIASKLEKETNHIRTKAARDANFSAAIAYPIMSGDNCLGVIELFGKLSLIENPESIGRLMRPLCYHLGQFIERKKAEAAARQATIAQLKIGQAITENAPIGIAWLDKKLVIAEANQAFCRQFDVARQDILGSVILHLNTGIPREWLFSVLNKGLPISQNNYLTEREGFETFCDLNIWPVMDETESPDGLVILSVDVTERVELAKQKEDFVATLTHDLKNPLIGQVQVLGGLLDGKLGSLNAAQVDVLSIVKSGTNELLDLIKMLLDVYRYDAGEQKLVPEQVNIAEEIASILAQYKPLTERRDLAITGSNIDTSINIFADRMAIRRVISNLVNNSIKFTKDPGTITISCEQMKDLVRITVKDNGYGIPKAEIPFLFQRFAKGKSQNPNKAGTGLGLYLCKQIVEKHGGDISCKSKKGDGTEFTITLPVKVPGEVQI